MVYADENADHNARPQVSPHPTKGHGRAELVPASQARQRLAEREQAVALREQQVAERADRQEEREQDLEVLEMRLIERERSLEAREGCERSQAAPNAQQGQDDERREALAIQERQLGERAGRLAARERRLAQEESSFATRAQKLAEEDADCAMRRQKVVDDEAAMARRERRLSEQEKLLQEKERRLSEQEKLLQEKERCLALQDTSLSTRQQHLADEEAVGVARQHRQNEHHRQLEDREAALRAREDAVRARELQLDARETAADIADSGQLLMTDQSVTSGHSSAWRSSASTRSSTPPSRTPLPVTGECSVEWACPSPRYLKAEPWARDRLTKAGARLENAPNRTSCSESPDGSDNAWGNRTYGDQIWWSSAEDVHAAEDLQKDLASTSGRGFEELVLLAEQATGAQAVRPTRAPVQLTKPWGTGAQSVLSTPTPNRTGHDQQMGSLGQKVVRFGSEQAQLITINSSPAWQHEPEASTVFLPPSSGEDACEYRDSRYSIGSNIGGSKKRLTARKQITEIDVTDVAPTTSCRPSLSASGRDWPVRGPHPHHRDEEQPDEDPKPAGALSRLTAPITSVLRRSFGGGVLRPVSESEI
mmetsp:Transcript_143069/g.274821  ORF Transcript_143069/g.274821 Transcript_143069/m.274821 type:complete len:594 (-) Transcript_143069:54-1835(-)